jgi:hypothetical protein
MIWISDFIDSYKIIKEYSLVCNFSDVVNPYDGVVYPHICTDMPDPVKSEINKKLTAMFGSVKINAIFLRMSPEGVNAPHMAHTDNSMGTKSLMLYLFDREDAGTAMLRHLETGAAYAPTNNSYLQPLIEDMNNKDAWVITERTYAKENLAVIFDADRFHCALPVGGFGESQKNARIVLTVFFEVL